jgi:hypothetical protein
VPYVSIPIVFILDIKKASTDSKEKRIIRTGLDINSKVDIYLYRLKRSLYNILTLNKVLRDCYGRFKYDVITTWRRVRRS